jgi:trigger factor
MSSGSLVAVMLTTVEETEKHTVKLTIEVPPEDVQRDLDRTYRAIANSVKIPGFRKGKAPKKVIDAQVGRDVVMEEFVNEAVPSYFRTAVTDEDLAPIAEPQIDLEQLEEGKPLIFTATVEVRPRLEFQESDYKGIPVQRPSTEVKQGEIDEWLERLRERFAELEPVARPVIAGDFVTIDLKGIANGEELPQATRSDYLYAVGSAEFGPALDAELMGAKPGTIVKVNDELPERFSELAGKPVELTALVKDVKARKLPELDDDFATTASEFDTLDELRADLRERLGELKEREAQAVVRDRVLDAMIERVDVELPESLVAEETEHRIIHSRERAERAGMNLDQLLQAQGWDRARLERDSRDHAIRAIKSDLALEGVARAEKIEVTAEEIGAEVASLAQAYDRDPKEIAKQLERSGQIVTLAGDIIRAKALDIVVENAVITDENADAAGASQQEPAAGPESPKES